MKTPALLALLFLSHVSLAQMGNYRLKADFSLKETIANGKYHLFMGTVYYNVNKSQLLYDLKFPMEQKWFVTDDATYMIAGDTLMEKKEIPGFVEQSLFHLALQGDLRNFGLSETFLKMTSVEKDKDMVISTWEPNEENEIFQGKIMTSVQDNKLFGVVYLGADGEVMSKQFYEDYENFDGVLFPGKVVYILNLKGEEHYRIMSFRDIKFNESGNEDLYNYTISE